MSTKLIRLEDGTLVEVEVPESEAQQISGGLADKVDATFSKIKPVLLKVCQPVASAVKELRDRDVGGREKVRIGDKPAQVIALGSEDSLTGIDLAVLCIEGGKTLLHSN